MPRLPRNVPLSAPAEEDMIHASLVFACTSCWSTNHWGFTAYNDKGQVYQVRRCRYWACYGNDGKGKWITPEEAHQRTIYQVRADEL